MNLIKIVEKELRATINNEFSGIVSKLLEIPSKDHPYEPKKVIYLFESEKIIYYFFYYYRIML